MSVHPSVWALESMAVCEVQVEPINDEMLIHKKSQDLHSFINVPKDNFKRSQVCETYSVYILC